MGILGYNNIPTKILFASVIGNFYQCFSDINILHIFLYHSQPNQQIQLRPYHKQSNFDIFLCFTVIDCGEAPSISNAYDYTPGYRTWHDNSLSVACKGNYQIQGSNSIGTQKVKCQENGVWDVGNITCVGKENPQISISHIQL